MSTFPQLFVAAFLSCSILVNGLDNGMIRTPPMGWSTWNRFHCGINETLVKQMADVLAVKMMKYGYEYVNLDDCWLDKERTSNGSLQGDRTTFPSGMKALSDYIHAKGLKFGLYGDPGTHTCAGRPGNQGNEVRDAATYASWGCDYFKYDSCSASHTYQLHAYQDMRDALNRTGRPIGYSICPDASRCNDAGAVMWDASSVANVNMCRGDQICRKATNDIEPTWKSWTCILDVQTEFNSMRYAGPGHFIMPDMVEVGNGMTYDEDKSLFSLWAMIAAPLVAGNDLRSMSDETLGILTNEEVIAVNQDPMGKPGTRVFTNKLTEVWSRQLHTGDYTVVLFNRDETVQSISLLWKYIGLPPDQPAKLRDLWLHEDLGTFSANYTTMVPPHGVKMYKAVQVRGGMTVSNVSVTVSECQANSQAQSWAFHSPDATVRQISSGMCLDVYDCMTEKQKNVQMYSCHVGQSGCGSRNQEWRLNSNGTITTALDGSCLTLTRGTNADIPYPVETQKCDNKTEQLWEINGTVVYSKAVKEGCLTA